jgi:hypothetical protein
MSDLPFYRIKNWSDYFENNRTREMVSMKWVPVPNKHDGEGFQTIMSQKDGIIIYGCWHLILQVASKAHPRGTLLREDGTPMTSKTLSLKTNWKRVEDFDRALRFCSSSEVGWLEYITENGAQIPQEGAGIPQEGAQKGREGKGIEKNGIIKYASLLSAGLVPINLIFEVFGEAWDDFVDHRKQIRKPLTELAAKKLLQILSEMSPVDAVTAINNSIANGWQGIFEPKASNQKKSASGDKPLDQWTIYELNSTIDAKKSEIDSFSESANNPNNPRYTEFRNLWDSLNRLKAERSRRG